jgi:hypothetical protein
MSRLSGPRLFSACLDLELPSPDANPPPPSDRPPNLTELCEPCGGAESNLTSDGEASGCRWRVSNVGAIIKRIVPNNAD